ncbi:hypothetical protein CLOP_g18223 [Closterium sp. NIES-67]|nr:hypothetical protein CLOP_g18223 [Closterium sp. NIES-67]
MRAPHVRAYADLLARMQAEVASEVGIAPDSIAYSYKHVSNGFAAVLSPAQLRRLVRHSAVASARPSRPLRADTTDSPAFLGLVGRAAAGSARGRGSGGMWRTFGGQQRAGEGWNFSASRPKGWSGSCDATSDFKCNNKIIGARIFNAAFRAKHGKPDLATDWLSPRDGFGHGTWCAGAAAGNSGVPMEGGRASGMAPAARIAAYKVFWYAQGARPEMRGLGGETADLLAAVNQGVADGVHVLSISLSADDPEATYFDDVPYMHANLAGVTVVMSAGNNGAPLHGPWARTAASPTSRPSTSPSGPAPFSGEVYLSPPPLHLTAAAALLSQHSRQPPQQRPHPPAPLQSWRTSRPQAPSTAPGRSLPRPPLQQRLKARHHRPRGGPLGRMGRNRSWKGRGERRRGRGRGGIAAVGDVDGDASPGGHCCSHHAEAPLVEPGAGHVRHLHHRHNQGYQGGTYPQCSWCCRVSLGNGFRARSSAEGSISRADLRCQGMGLC